MGSLFDRLRRLAGEPGTEQGPDSLGGESSRITVNSLPPSAPGAPPVPSEDRERKDLRPVNALEPVPPVPPVAPGEDQARRINAKAEAGALPAHVRTLLLGCAVSCGCDADELAAMLEAAARDPEGARRTFEAQARDLGLLADRCDDRRRCVACATLADDGACLAARRGQILAARNYAPVPELLRRCEGFLPKPGDPDPQPGRERWPGLA